MAHDYDAFYVDKEHGSIDEVRAGESWLRSWRGSDEALLITPVSDQLQYSAVAGVFGHSLRTGRQVQFGDRLIRPVTWRTYPPRNPGWSGGPVLALWPDQRFLGKLHDDYRVKALCVVAGSMDEVRPWIAATGATDLLTGTAASGPGPLDPVVEQAMLSLDMGLNHSNLLLGSADKAQGISALQVLHRGGYRLDPEDLEAWALAHEWPAEEAARFREFAENIERGHKYRSSNWGWRDDILDYWKKKASGDVE